MSSKIFVENHGKRILIIFVLINLKREIKADTGFVLKAKTLILNVLRKQSHFD